MDSKTVLLLARFRYGPNTCSHCTKVWHRTYPICDAPPSARHSFALSLTEIASKSPFAFVNRISFRYGFRASVRAIWYRVNIASNMQNDYGYSRKNFGVRFAFLEKKNDVTGL